MSSLKRENIKKIRLKGGYVVRDVDVCPECGSDSWSGYLQCKLCYAYYSKAKCVKCGHIRMEVCMARGDHGSLDFYESKWKPKREKGTRSA